MKRLLLVIGSLLSVGAYAGDSNHIVGGSVGYGIQDFEFESLMKSAGYVGSYHEIAIGFLDEALKIRPNSLEALSMRAWLLYDSKEIDRAAVEYKKLLKSHTKETRKVLGKYSDLKQLIVD